MHYFTKTNEKSAGLNGAKEQINLNKQPRIKGPDKGVRKKPPDKGS